RRRAVAQRRPALARRFGGARRTQRPRRSARASSHERAIMSTLNAARAIEPAPAEFVGSAWEQAAAAAASHAPYVRRLMTRRPDLLQGADDMWAERLVMDAIAAANAIALEPPSIEDAM